MPRSYRQSIFWTGIGLGVVAAGMTFFAGPLALGSGNEILDGMKIFATALMIPGLVVAAGVGSLAAGAVINLFFYVLIGGLLSIVLRRKDRSKVP